MRLNRERVKRSDPHLLQAQNTLDYLFGGTNEEREQKAYLVNFLPKRFRFSASSEVHKE